MSIAAGSRLGPYEILAPLGAGGMGEVYRARDPRLNRAVAIKVLPEDFLEGEERRGRFEREAQLLAALNHPNVAAIYSFEEIPGSSVSPSVGGSRHILVMELLEGETLRVRLAGGALPVRKAIDTAVQIAKGLAAAHEKGIIHRDLKPENLFLTKDGRVKILDFGLAKLRLPPGSGAGTNLPTESAGTEAGVVVGTVGYMSPEQVKGQPIDQRSDIFSLGAVLYEMLSGARAFRGPSAAETMSAILREDPPDLTARNPDVPPALEKIVRRCLEKSPEERFRSAHDLAFALETLSSPSSSGVVAARGEAAKGRLSRRLLIGAVLAAVLCTGLTAVILRRTPSPPPPAFRQITFRRGTIWSARFGSDGKTVLYSAAWDGGPIEIDAGRSDGPDSRPFGLKDANLLAVAPSGEVAVSLGVTLSPDPTIFSWVGTLARTAGTGGTPREILENVEFADFSPGGNEMAVVHRVSGRRRLEYPVGKVLYETGGWIGDPRVSPGGDRIAFLDHPALGDDGGNVSVVDRSGRKSDLTAAFASTEGLAWSPDGLEIWFTASEKGSNRALRAVTLSGRTRVLFAGTGGLTVHDVARDGRALLSHDTTRIGFAVRLAGVAEERDLSWFDTSVLAALSADGRTALFTEAGEAGGPGYSVCLRTTDGAPPVRLGEGLAESLSPDGRQVLAVLHPVGDQRLIIYPTGPGERRLLPYPDLKVTDATWHPDGRRIVMTASGRDGVSRVYLADSGGGSPTALTPAGRRVPFGAGLVDAGHVLSQATDGKWFLDAIDGGPSAPVSGIGPDDTAPGTSGKDGTILVRRGRGLPARLVRLDLATGREERFADLMPSNATGIVDVTHILVARDGRSWGYDYARILSDLFVVEGLR